MIELCHSFIRPLPLPNSGDEYVVSIAKRETDAKISRAKAKVFLLASMQFLHIFVLKGVIATRECFDIRDDAMTKFARDTQEFFRSLRMVEDAKHRIGQADFRAFACTFSMGNQLCSLSA